LLDDKTFWHPAFRNAVQLDLEEYGDGLEYQEEKPLTTEPLRMDLLIIKKAPGVIVTKSIGRIFQKHNIWEYKSPQDHISIFDYHKVLAYARLYMALEKILSRNDITVTIISSRHPRKLLSYLEHNCGFSLERSIHGIVYVHGDTFPVQIINRRRLGKDTLWLQNLSDDLNNEEMWLMAQEMQKVEDQQKALTVIMTLISANPRALEEGSTVTEEQAKEALMSLAEKRGWDTDVLNKGKQQGIQLGMQQGREKEKLEVAKNLLLHMDVQTIAAVTGLSEAVRHLCSHSLRRYCIFRVLWYN